MSSDPQVRPHLRTTGAREQRLDWLMLDALRGRFIVFDENLVVTGCAGRGLERCGLDRDDVIAGELAAVLPGSFEEHEPWCRAALEGDSSTVEVRAEDGRTYEIEFSPARSEVGESRRGLALVRDITEARRAHEALAATEQFEASFDDAPTGIALIAFDGTLMRVNGALCRMLGRSADELVGSSTMSFTHPDDRERRREGYELLREGRGPFEFEKRYLRPDGGVVWARTQSAAVNDASGDPTHIVAHVQDITALKVAELARAEATELFENAFTNAPIGMALVSIEGTFMKVNGATCELLGYPEPELLALTFQEITHPDDLEADLRQVQRLVAGEIERYSMPKRYYTKAGEEVWANLSVTLVRNDVGEPVHFISQIEDISDRKRLEAALQHLADHDPLTGLWNRRAFDQELERELARCRRHGLEAALLLVDLNHFKHVNDTYGHSAGDELLRKIAAKLQARLRATDSIARLGGDEFVIILPNTSQERATRVAAAVEDEVRAAGSRVGEQEAYVTASVGVTALDKSTVSARAAMADADRAMYRAKHRG